LERVGVGTAPALSPAGISRRPNAFQLLHIKRWQLRYDDEHVIPATLGCVLARTSRRVVDPNREPQRIVAGRTSKMRDFEPSVGILDLDEFAVDATGPAHRGRQIHRSTDSVSRNDEA